MTPLRTACPLTTHEVLTARPCSRRTSKPSSRRGAGHLRRARRAGRAVRAGLAAAGIGRGDRVGICLGNGPDWVALFLAIGAAGAVAVPVNTRFTADEVRYTLKHAQVRTLFVASRVLNVGLRPDAAGDRRRVCSVLEDGRGARRRRAGVRDALG